MYQIYRWLYNQFAFSRAQSNGFLILLPILLICVFSEPLYRRWVAGSPGDFADESRQLDSLVALFKPLEAANAVFKERDSFRYPEQKKPFDVQRRDEPKKFSGFSHEKRSAMSPLDLNLADTTVLKTIPGIGSKLSARIIRYREALGGFHSTDQLFEVYNLDSAVVMSMLKVCFIDPSFQIKQLNINTADRQELAGHPYLSASEASAIVTYRFHHGEFKSVQDIEFLQGIDLKRVARVLPYLRVE